MVADKKRREKGIEAEREEREGEREREIEFFAFSCPQKNRFSVKEDCESAISKDMNHRTWGFCSFAVGGR
jgi:hypothetical protein